MAAPDRRVLATLLVVALLVGVGTVVLLESDDAGELPENATAIQQTVSDRVSNLESYRVTMVQTVEYGNRTQQVRMHVAYEAGRYNVTYLDAPGGAHPVFMANETNKWYYDPTHEVVRRRPRNQSRTTNLLARFTDSLFDHENVSYDGSETLAGTETMTLSYSQYNQTISVAFGGKQVSQLAIPERYGNATTRIWVDAERRLPVRVRTTATRNGDSISRTVRLTDVELGVDVADERLDAPPVSDVPVVTEQRPVITRYATRAALVGNTTGPLSTASVPDGFEFTRGLHIENPNGTTITQVYTDGVSELGIMRTDPAVTDDDVDPNMTIAGRPAEFEEQYVYYGHGRVRWRCGDYEYFVSARTDTALTKAEMIDVARSAGCPG